jgi:RNA polymerase sigma factor (TIGR02999 family)
MSSELERLLRGVQRGEPRATDELLPLVYGELRALAAQRLARERPGATLQATALVHEAWLRLVGDGKDRGPEWDGVGHFWAAAAESIRRILVESARGRAAEKRGGGQRPVTLGDVAEIGGTDHDAALDLDEALAAFAVEEPRKAHLVELRYFAGLSLAEAAVTLGISAATADRDWAYARAWLHDRLRGPRPKPGKP